jgi:hypothetical protein
MAFTIYISRTSPDHIRGYLDRFAQEIHPGVWISDHTPPVRDALWKVLCDRDGNNLMAYVDRTNPQGYIIKTNSQNQKVIDIGGFISVISILKE